MNYSNYYIKKCEKSNKKPNMEFVIWITNIESFIEKNLNLSLLELPDDNYMFYFENGTTSEYIINKIIKDNYLIL